jgi:hypothetical protein
MPKAQRFFESFFSTGGKEVRTSLAVILVLLTTTSFLMADTINVPGDFPAIQDAIDAAVGGDTILVSPGTYSEIINFNGKGIILKSVDGPESTIIHAKPSYPAITFDSDEGPHSILDGFTITGGNVTIEGVWCINSNEVYLCHST